MSLPMPDTPELMTKATEALKYCWPLRARPEQMQPPGDWRIWLIKTGRGWGKALALDTPIPTLSGWTTMGEIMPGDVVFDENGNPCNVTFATEVQYGRECYEVGFSDGTKVVADAEHLWETMDKPARKAAGRAANPRKKASIVTTLQIKNTLMHNEREINHSVQLCKPLNIGDKDLPIPPYVLGVWLGDGHSQCAAFTVGYEDREEMVANIEAAGMPVNGKPHFSPDGRTMTVAMGIKPQKFAWESMTAKLRRLGLIKNKHIPMRYLRASEEQRAQLLCGLMDTDGSVQDGGHAEFLATSLPLCQGVYELACTLGLKPTWAEERATLNGRDCGPRYRVSFTPHRRVFNLARKYARQHTGKSQSCRNFRRYIISVSKVDSVPVRCITVDSASHLYLCSKAFIPTHNTRTACETIRAAVESGRYKRIHLVARTAADCRDTMVEGESGILAISSPRFRPRYEPSKRRLVWPNGVQATLFSAEEPEALRGPQSDFWWADEMASWKYLQETWDQLQFGARLGNDVRGIITTTPKPHKILKELIARPTTFTTHGHTMENAANLSTHFLEQMKDRYEGTRLGRQELAGEILDDNPAALWKRSQIDSDRVSAPPVLERIVVAIDPSCTDTGDEAGIVCCGKGTDGHYYLLDDVSTQASPDAWARAAVNLYHNRNADRIIYETNQGGQMVTLTLQTIDRNVPLRGIHASRGKITRAEPIAALAEQHRIHHCGCFPQLEDELCDYDGTGASPNRLDAFVYAITELHQRAPGIITVA